ncbi:MAG: hypothetical protein AAGP08_03880 [Pseudomonadota bacterium]
MIRHLPQAAIALAALVAPASAEMTVDEATSLSDDMTEGLSYVVADELAEDESVFELYDVSFDQVGNVALEIERGTLGFAIGDIEIIDEEDAEDAAGEVNGTVLEGLAELNVACAENSDDCITFTPNDGLDETTIDELSLWGSDDTVDALDDTILEIKEPAEDGS